MDFNNVEFHTNIFFSGSIFIEFYEEDIVIKSIGFNELFSRNEIEAVDKAKEILIYLKNRNVNKLKLNNIKPLFFDFEYYNQYFESNEKYYIAIKDYFYEK